MASADAELKSDGTLELSLHRDFAYPPEDVFDAWLEPDKLAIWMGHSEEMQARNVQADAVVGGAYSMEFDGEHGQPQHLHGRYREIVRYTRLVFTWVWEPPFDNHPETLVTVTLEPIATGTRLHLLHQRFRTAYMRDCHAQGWEGTFAKLFSRLDRVLGKH